MTEIHSKHDARRFFDDRTILKVIVSFVLLSVITIYLLEIYFFRSTYFNWYMSSLSNISSAALGVLGIDIAQDHSMTMGFFDFIYSPKVAWIRLDEDQSGLYAICAIVCGVIAWSGKWMTKLWVIPIAASAAFAINVLTVVFVFLAEYHLPLYSLFIAEWLVPITKAIILATIFIGFTRLLKVK